MTSTVGLHSSVTIPQTLTTTSRGSHLPSDLQAKRPGTTNFQVCVATPRAVSRVRLTGHMPGILVNRFDADTVGRAIRDRVSSIQAHAWFQVVDQLREFMHWEYEGM